MSGSTGLDINTTYFTAKTISVVTNFDVEITHCAVSGLIQPGEEDF